MISKGWNNTKLGLFVLAGLFVLIAGLYLIGKDTNLFSKNYSLRARFSNVEGLIVGNNVRYSGIQVGSVKKVQIINDTTIEVTMLIKEDMQQYIHKNDIASIGTDGLVGNRLINIIPSKTQGELAIDNDMLQSKTGKSPEEMLETLDKTNQNLVIISDELKKTIVRINNNNALWKILEDSTLPNNIRASISHIHDATQNADKMTSELYVIINDVKQGKGSVGSLLRDSSFSQGLEEAVAGVKTIEAKAADVMDELNTLIKNIQADIATGNGPANAALRDSLLVIKVHQSLSNIKAGTASFTENMEALKHNFLFKGYFKKKEKKKQKAATAKEKK